MSVHHQKVGALHRPSLLAGPITHSTIKERGDDPFEAVSDDLRVVTSNLKQNDFFFL